MKSIKETDDPISDDGDDTENLLGFFTKLDKVTGLDSRVSAL